MQRTFALIKPDAVAAGHQSAILSRIQSEGLRVVALKSLRLSKAQAEGFYHVHAERPFFGDLVTFMTEGPIVAMALEGEDAIAKNRGVMGSTNPADAAEGTIRATYAESIEANSVHGSDAPESAAAEIAYFFNDDEIVG